MKQPNDGKTLWVIARTPSSVVAEQYLDTNGYWTNKLSSARTWRFVRNPTKLLRAKAGAAPLPEGQIKRSKARKVKIMSPNPYSGAYVLKVQITPTTEKVPLA